MIDGPHGIDIPDQVRRSPLAVRSATPADGVRVVAVAGELDLLTSPQLGAALVVTAAHALRRLVLDLGQVGFFGSSGIAALMRARDDAFRSGHELYLVGALGNPAVAVPLEITGLSSLFDHRASVPDALDGLVPARAH